MGAVRYLPAPSVATSIGVLIAAVGIWQTRRSALLTFELTFTERYRMLADQMPLEALQGKEFELTPESKRILFHYLELCEEEMYHRRHGRIASATWIDWWIGISRNLDRATPLSTACLTVMDESDYRFDLLRSAMTEDFAQRSDPCTARPKRWYCSMRRRQAMVAS